MNLPGLNNTNNQVEKGRQTSWKNYIPLIVIITLVSLAASAKQEAYGSGWHWMTWMNDFMGFFLVIFSMFKFFDIDGFANGFHMYDLLARQFRSYGYFYPFIELSLGLAYLGNWLPKVVYSLTVILMIFGAIGVFRALHRKLNVDCACLGTMLRVPLSTVAIVENLGMAMMALGMLLIAEWR